MSRPEGERYACEKCGAELVYVKACNCNDGGVTRRSAAASR